jgi:hypothetical protein
MARRRPPNNAFKPKLHCCVLQFGLTLALGVKGRVVATREQEAWAK